ncbi:MAG TPA: hypothetical protein PLG97_02185 [Alcaligenes sp.]|nr:hypothetical protein [Alcaligenes sp.]HRL26304.1 hypothetical protein [Alcaligenes sp.]
MNTDAPILGEARATHLPLSSPAPAPVYAKQCNKNVTPAANALLGKCEFYYRPLHEEYVAKSGVSTWEVFKAWSTEWNPWDDLIVARRLLLKRDQLIAANNSDDNWSRHANFMVRHIGCGHQPPDYYVSYGYYYCSTYGERLRPRLSSAGQTWLDNARYNLQKNIEKGLKDNMDGDEITVICRRYPNRTVNMTVPQYELEVTPQTFKSFAFQTHVPAYLDAGLADLPLSDLLKIGGQPNIEEWLDRETRSQAIDSTVEVAKDWGNSALHSLGDAYDATKDAMGNAIDATLESLTRHLRF